MEQDFKRIITHYGLLPQLKYFQSEVFELNEAILTKEIDYQSSDTTVSMDKTNLEHITEEIADVCVMLREFMAHYGISQDEVAEIMEYKTKRQLRRIDDEINNV